MRGEINDPCQQYSLDRRGLPRPGPPVILTGMVVRLEVKEPRDSPRPHRGESALIVHVRRFRTAYWLLLIGLAGSAGLFVATRHLVEEHQKILFKSGVDDTVRILDLHFAGDLNVVISLQGVFDIHKRLESEAIRAFLRTRNYESDHGAMGNVGFCVPVFSTNRTTEHASLLERGMDRFFPREALDLEASLPIVFLNDSSQGRLRGAGWDAFGSDRIRAAMDQARDSGEMVASYKIPLASTNQVKPLEGFVVFFPLYATKSVPASIAERRTQFVGLAFGTFPTDPLWKNMIGPGWPHLVNLAVFEGGGMRQENLLFDLYGEAEEGAPASWKHPPRYAQIDRKAALRREWDFVITSSDHLNHSSERRFPALVLALGCLVSLVLFIVEVVAFRRIEKLMGQLRTANEAFWAEKERLSVTLRSLGDGVIAADTHGRVTLMNKVAETLTGWSQEESLGRPVEEIFRVRGGPGSGGAVTKVENAPPDGEGAPPPPTTLTHRSGSQCVVSESTAPIFRSDHSVAGAVLVFRDVTERQNLEARLRHSERMESVGRLAGGIAHDFNNLLTVITGNLELAKSLDREPASLAQCLEEVDAAAQRATGLTRQLLAFSRRQIIEPRVVNLNDLVRDLQNILTRVIREDISLKTVLGNGLGSVRVDVAQFEHVLINLAVNARDAMPRGGNLRIETANVDLGDESRAGLLHLQPGRFVLLAVTDTGQGMSEEVKRHIFEPFFTTKPKGQGTGLGLASVFGAVQQAGGAIEADSEVGRGTSFKIYLPRVEEQPEKLHELPADSVTPGGTETVLLVEDEESLRHLAERMLKRLGYSVLPASNGTEAMQTLERHGGPVDLLLTDVVLPGLSGRELFEQLARIRPRLKVLFVSGYNEDVILRHGVAKQKLSFIGKPYSMRSLAEKIRQVLG